jgi:predicted acetyltransferase
MLDSVTIRPILPDELDKVALVLALSCEGHQPTIRANLENTPRYNFAHMLLAEYQGEAIGTMTVFPAQMWLSGVPISIAAVTGMGVIPQFRNKGIGSKMMDFSMVRMFAEGRAMSVLFPHSHKFFRRFGYAPIGDLHAYRLNPLNLIVFAEGHKVRPFQPGDLPMMRVMYKGQLTWHNGWFTRTNEWWEKIIQRWPNIMVYDNDGTIEGYFSYEIDTDQRGVRTLHIREFFAAEDEAYRGLIGYLAAQNEADVIEYMAPPDTLLRHSLRQPRADDAQPRGGTFFDLCHVTSGLMGRIINLRLALTTRFYTRGLSGERVIRVKDPSIPTNEAPILFRVVDGRAETRSTDGRKPQIETDITTLTQVICGYLSPFDARRLGRLQTDEDTCSWLAKAIVDNPPYIQGGDWF